MRCGIVRPRLVTWSIWTVLSAILTISALSSGHIASAALSAQGLLGCGLVVILGWKHGTITLTNLDKLSLTGAVIGIASLIVFRDPAISLLTSVAVDAIAYAPTLVHGWTDPDEESLTCYLCSTGASVLALVVAVIEQVNFIGFIYPLYAVAFNGGMALLLIIGRYALQGNYEYEGEEA